MARPCDRQRTQVREHLLFCICFWFFGEVQSSSWPCFSRSQVLAGPPWRAIVVSACNSTLLRASACAVACVLRRFSTGVRAHPQLHVTSQCGLARSEPVALHGAPCFCLPPPPCAAPPPCMQRRAFARFRPASCEHTTCALCAVPTFREPVALKVICAAAASAPGPKRAWRSPRQRGRPCWC